MLQNTFMHIPGIGPRTEQRLWESGIRIWDDFTPGCPVRLSPREAGSIAAYLAASKQNLEVCNPVYFQDLLPASQHWRFFPEFRDVTVYLDIETTGLGNWGDIITTIALYDGASITHYINGQNLDQFMEDISRYKVIITYNGKTFDVPFIERFFGINLDHAHIDLRYILASLGYSGGLKSCEIQLGIDRKDLKDIDGFFAVLLWHDYQRTCNRKTLETLLAYNIQDVLTLENLMVIAYNLKIRDTPCCGNKLAAPVLPPIPFEVDPATVRRIKRELERRPYGRQDITNKFKNVY